MYKLCLPFVVYNYVCGVQIFRMPSEFELLGLNWFEGKTYLITHTSMLMILNYVKIVINRWIWDLGDLAEFFLKAKNFNLGI